MKLKEDGLSKSGESSASFPLTVSHEATLAESLQADAAFRREYLARVVEAMLEGDLAVGQDMLHSFVLPTIGFQRLENNLQLSDGSLDSTLSAHGKPLAEENL